MDTAEAVKVQWQTVMKQDCKIGYNEFDFLKENLEYRPRHSMAHLALDSCGAGSKHSLQSRQKKL